MATVLAPQMSCNFAIFKIPLSHPTQVTVVTRRSTLVDGIRHLIILHFQHYYRSLFSLSRWACGS